MAVLTYQCPHCGGELVFDPKDGRFACPFCLSRFTEDEVKALDPARQSEQAAQPSGEAEAASSAREQPAGEDAADEFAAHAVVYHCPTCGAEIVTDDTTAATRCHYCHNPVVLEGRLSGADKPDALIPFRYDREQAVHSFLDWVGKRKFVPRDFFSKKQIENLTGVYLPYWVTDAGGEVSLRGVGRRVRIWRTGDIEYTETRNYRVERAGSIEFKEYTSIALQKADRELTTRILPYDFSELIDFSMPYLSGYQADRYDIARETVAPGVENQLRAYSEQLLRGRVDGYASVSVENVQADLSRQSWRCALLPVWLLTYRDKRKDKLYYFAMNGQTGEIVGELPLSRGRLAALFAAVFVPVFLLTLLGGWLL